MPLLERTIKMVVTTILAILIAESLQLTYAISAGIIALLSLHDTRKTSLKVARERLFAFFLAFCIAFFSFTVFGFSMLAFTVYLSFSIPILYLLKLESGLVPITVLVTHLLVFKSLNFQILSNEFLLFIIGTSTALLGNAYMKTPKKEIQQYHVIIEKELKDLLFQLESSLLTHFDNRLYHSLEQLEDLLGEALVLVYRDSHNQVFQQTNYHVHYFEMRRHQLRIVDKMVKSCKKITERNRQSILLAHFIHETAEQLSETNSALTLREDISLLLETYRQGELPKTRLEFENRSQIFQILQDLEQFILEKIEFYKEYKEYY
ncbi:aromatic acid exporter family protein [Streptococcus porcinus]|uniref:Membrane protein n=2 Tax=Streptococcus porcinus TaxID=1340 RepID=A0A4V0H606_STRPO|nr:aromatic acid exporter family protein [Streptococcus porcinus]EGJ26533.1 hypothetical protein STRPO_0342 [Streptococcus porcinus str. Jelinkova 176]SQG44082.1 membrane protein [Streptococcus porcinus]VTT43448.1 membrane protein [Streptococcus porcinus]VTT44887.1 membrane protein [Streptococcus porcinus]